MVAAGGTELPSAGKYCLTSVALQISVGPSLRCSIAGQASRYSLSATDVAPADVLSATMSEVSSCEVIHRSVKSLRSLTGGNSIVCRVCSCPDLTVITLPTLTTSRISPITVRLISEGGTAHPPPPSVSTFSSISMPSWGSRLRPAALTRAST